MRQYGRMGPVRGCDSEGMHSEARNKMCLGAVKEEKAKYAGAGANLENLVPRHNQRVASALHTIPRIALSQLSLTSRTFQRFIEGVGRVLGIVNR